MPRLQILQHKSYHPYLEKNKQRVREDEAKAAEAELAKEQIRVEKDSEARLNELRRRAGSPSLQPKAEQQDEEEEDDNLPSTSTSKDVGSSLLEKHRKKKAKEEKKERKLRERLDFDFPSETARREDRAKERDKGKGKEREVEQDEGDERFSGLNRGGGRDGEERYHDKSWDDGGHINFFQDIEQNEKPRAPTLAEISKKKAEQEADKFTMYLKRPEREVKPWYTDRELKRAEERATDEEAERRRARDQRKDVRSKERHDPMTQVNALLKPTAPVRRHANPPTTAGATPSDPSAARLQREQSERQRALALIAKTKAASQPKFNGTWQDTPSTVAHPGGGGSWAEDLERRKERASNRFWDEERERDRVKGWEKGVRSGRGGRSWEV